MMKYADDDRVQSVNLAAYGKQEEKESISQPMTRKTIEDDTM